MSNLPTNPGRRGFLLRASVAAAAGVALGDAVLEPLRAAGQSATPTPAGGVQSFTAAGLHNIIGNLEANPGNNTIVNDKTFIVMLTVEKKKAAKEFEWHEGRDHVFLIRAGSTVIEIGGTPKNAHSTGPGEWNAPVSEDAVPITLNAGDMLVIPRGTPHRRTTKNSVTLMLISPQGTA